MEMEMEMPGSSGEVRAKKAWNGQRPLFDLSEPVVVGVEKALPYALCGGRRLQSAAYIQLVDRNFAFENKMSSTDDR